MVLAPTQPEAAESEWHDLARGEEVNVLVQGIIEDFLPEGDFVPSLIAKKVAAHLREEEQLLMGAWLDAMLEPLLTSRITHVLGRQRQQSRKVARQAEFRSAAESAEKGDFGPVRTLFETYCSVNEENLRRRIGDMTGEDHRFVAKAYSSDAKRSGLLAKFHEAVATKVGTKRTSEVFTEEKYAQMLRSILGNEYPD